MKPKYRSLELFIQALIFYSIGTYFVELEFTHAEHSTGFFLWSERIVAALFTIEHLTRWTVSRSLFYPLRWMSIVDLVAILPFYIGFLVDLRALRLVRTLRILRLFKLYRYSVALQNIRNAFNRVRYEFGIIGFAVFTVGWISAVAIYELERDRQPEAFGRLSDALWYVITTLTTVGYGDKIPVTAGGRLVAACTMIVGLGLFGTFVSLIGSAFLEEIRHSTRSQAKGVLEKTEPQDFLPDYLQAMTLGRFDPSRCSRPSTKAPSTAQGFGTFGGDQAVSGSLPDGAEQRAISTRGRAKQTTAADGFDMTIGQKPRRAGSIEPAPLKIFTPPVPLSAIPVPFWKRRVTH